VCTCVHFYDDDDVINFLLLFIIFLIYERISYINLRLKTIKNTFTKEQYLISLSEKEFIGTLSMNFVTKSM